MGPGSRASRAVAAVAGASALATSWSGILAAFAPAAEAAPAPDQDVLNDWGQTAAEVTEEVNLVVDADVNVIAARTRYLHALSTYASLKQSQQSPAGAQRGAQDTHDDEGRRQDRSHPRDRQQPRLRSSARGRRVAAGHGHARERPHRGRPRPALHPGAARHPADGPGRPQGRRRVGQISLSWTAVNGATGYRVYRDGVQIASTASPSFTDTGLDNGTPYGYSVLATNLAGWSPRSAEVIATPNAVAPSRPVGLVAAPGDGQVTLAWTATPAATSYQVFRNGTLVGSPATPTFVDMGLTNAVSYSYTVKALNGVAASPASSAVSCTPVATAPAPRPTWSPRRATRRSRSRGRHRRVPRLHGLPRRDVSRRRSRPGTWTPSSPTGRRTRTRWCASGRTPPPLPPPRRQRPPRSLRRSRRPPASRRRRATPGALTWGSVSGATSYHVYRGATLVPPHEHAHRQRPDQRHHVRLHRRRRERGASSAASSPLSATPAAACAGAPTGLRASPATSGRLTWTAAPGATSYRVYRGGVARRRRWPHVVHRHGAHERHDLPYTVTAVKQNSAESAASSAATATPQVPTPSTPDGRPATRGRAGDAVVERPRPTRSTRSTAAPRSSPRRRTTYIETGLTTARRRPTRSSPRTRRLERGVVRRRRDADGPGRRTDRSRRRRPATRQTR